MKKYFISFVNCYGKFLSAFVTAKTNGEAIINFYETHDYGNAILNVIEIEDIKEK